MNDHEFGLIWCNSEADIAHVIMYDVQSLLERGLLFTDGTLVRPHGDVVGINGVFKPSYRFQLAREAVHGNVEQGRRNN